MEIKILGSGSKGNCYWVSDGQSSLLLEAGLPYRGIQRGINFSASDLSGVLVSHEHLDHSRAVWDLLHSGIDCYMSKGTAVALGVDGHHRLGIMEASNGSVFEQTAIGSFRVIAFDTKHDSAEPMGFYLKSTRTDERLMFASDTCYVPNRFDGMNYILLEVNYCKEALDENVKCGRLNEGLRNRIVSSHMSLETALDFFRANDLSQVKQIILIHLSDSNSQAEKIRKAVQECTGRMVIIA